jgi:hypothetical protein
MTNGTSNRDMPDPKPFTRCATRRCTDTSERGATVIDAGIRQLGPEQWREPLDLASPELNGLAPRRRLLTWLGDHLQ